MPVQKRGNDAIPTCSGFNYQGKMSILCVLCKINELISNKENIKEYAVEFEQREDYVLLKNGKPEEFYQVKATLSKNKRSSYSEALKKLIKHRDDSGNMGASCFLVVANNIIDWDEEENDYKKKINLYKYCGKEVAVDNVKKCVIEEIKKFLMLIQEKCVDNEVLYGALCVFLDESIARMHKEPVVKRQYRISLIEFYNVLLDSLDKSRASNEYYLKEKVYDYAVKTIGNALKSVCTKQCNNSFIDCTKECAAKQSYQKILELPDLLNFCKVVNPSDNSDWENPFSVIGKMPIDKLEKMIFLIFYNSKNPTLVDAEKNMVFMHSKYCDSSKKCIVPTLLDLTDFFDYGPQSLQDSLQAIKENTNIVSVIEGNAITAKSSHYKGILSKSTISEAWKGEKTKKISHLSNEIEIIPIEQLSETFLKEGGNHE